MPRRTPDHRAGDVGRIIAFLDQHTYTKLMWSASYEYWSKGEALEGAYWQRKSGLGGTYTLMALMWFQHLHRPGSRLYRPSIIIEALCNAALGGHHANESREG